jgi:hypothetical protein
MEGAAGGEKAEFMDLRGMGRRTVCGASMRRRCGEIGGWYRERRGLGLQM